MNTDPDPGRKPPVLRKDWRFFIGAGLMILALVMPVFALLVPSLGLSVAQSAVVVGLLIAGGPEVICLLAVALLGRETFQHFTYSAKKLLRRTVLDTPASKTQYYAGLAINLASWLPLYLYGYMPEALPSGQGRIAILAGADIVFIASMFVMGGEFWGKFRRIFVWEGRI
jgi:hypothetical protein